MLYSTWQCWNILYYYYVFRSVAIRNALSYTTKAYIIYIPFILYDKSLPVMASFPTSALPTPSHSSACTPYPMVNIHFVFKNLRLRNIEPCIRRSKSLDNSNTVSLYHFITCLLLLMPSLLLLPN